jgi:hypothetical protein
VQRQAVAALEMAAREHESEIEHIHEMTRTRVSSCSACSTVITRSRSANGPPKILDDSTRSGGSSTIAKGHLCDSKACRQFFRERENHWADHVRILAAQHATEITRRQRAVDESTLQALSRATEGASELLDSTRESLEAVERWEQDALCATSAQDICTRNPPKLPRGNDPQLQTPKILQSAPSVPLRAAASAEKRAIIPANAHVPSSPSLPGEETTLLCGVVRIMQRDIESYPKQISELFPRALKEAGDEQDGTKR